VYAFNYVICCLKVFAVVTRVIREALGVKVLFLEHA